MQLVNRSICVARFGHAGYKEDYLCVKEPHAHLYLHSERRDMPFGNGIVAIPIAPPRVDSSKGPHRVNRAHWPTKENRLFFFLHFLCFSGT